MTTGKPRSRARLLLRFVISVAVVTGAHALHSGSADAATPPSAGVLAGLTSQGNPSFFKVSANGRMLEMGSIALNMNCTSGDQFLITDEFTRVPIGPKGKLHARYSGPPTSGSDGDTYAITDSLTASLNRQHTKVSGVWDLRVQYSFTNGMSDLCDSGPVRFTDLG
jgi:hypothetical protein